MPTIRDRVKELRRVRAGDLLPNPAQWRTHSDVQRRTLQGVISEIGFAGAALAYEDGNGQLVLADGHLRSSLDPNAIIPVLVTDLNEKEAKKLLATYDPLGAMAGQDQDALLALLRDVSFQDKAVNDLLEAILNGERVLIPYPQLPDGDRVPIGQMTFTVEQAQRTMIEGALDKAKSLGSFGDTGNENSNGNALARVCEFFLGQVVHA